jgi:hypothetical protein
MKQEKVKESPDKGAHSSHRVRLPGFLVQDEVGLGDIVQRVTYATGIRPCGGCERRAAALNRWMTFYR